MKLANVALLIALILSILFSAYQYIDRKVFEAYNSEYVSALERDLRIFCNLSSFSLDEQDLSVMFGVKELSHELHDGNYQLLINGGYFTLDANKVPIKLKHYYLGSLKIEHGKANCNR